MVVTGLFVLCTVLLAVVLKASMGYIGERYHCFYFTWILHIYVVNPSHPWD